MATTVVVSEDLDSVDANQVPTWNNDKRTFEMRPIEYRGGNRTIAIGDSITGGSDNQTTYQLGGSWFSRLCAESGQRLRFLRNAGVAGNTSTQMLARFATDVTAYHPDVVVIAPVTPNDVSQSVPVATRKTNIQAMVAAAQNDRSRVILVTGPPNDTAATKNSMVSMNTWLTWYGNSIGVPVWDIYSPLADPADGTYLADNTADGIHPDIDGQLAVVAALTSKLPGDLYASPFLTSGIGDPDNLITNGVFTGDTNADGIANSWTAAGTAFVSAQLTAITGGYGNWQELETDGSLGWLQQTISTGWSVGDILAFSGRFEADDAVNLTAQISMTGGASNPRGFSGWTQVLTDNHWYLEVPVLASTSAMDVRLTLNTTAGTVRFGQVTLRNLTALGLAGT